ncbi:hypothetical protein CAPTEDRAFT_6645 [Capitella teleta]|uniref:Enoyl reductase (ER) domain-containing protein n=1 Tax=Capitella teleta TaxID=283909 RepID=R7VME7_CAPTE|nr:hypothetical protein CAPTEDRAFT_6645 [Capitella teleta]|eukprot:ELU18710.1 hypothetical protein CAPTEDRAFT_6645 [Capitella teleta]
MSSWQVFNYGGPDQLKLSHTAVVPSLTDPRGIIVKVHAASVNPLDTKMIGGYGASLLSISKKFTGKSQGRSLEFPFTPGMDFSGEIVQTGKLVPSRKFSPGSHAQYTLANCNWVSFNQGLISDKLIIFITKQVSHKPKSLSHCEAASIPYAAATTWSSLFLPPKGIREGNMSGRRVLVLGGSGGVGTFAIQLFKVWGADVTVVCGSDSVERCLMLGADVTLDYQNYDVKQELKDLAKFDLIFDLVGQGKYDFTKQYLREYKAACYISLVHPVMKNFDQYGFALGALRTAVSAGLNVAKNLSEGKQFHWGFHQPNAKCMSTVAQLVEDGKIHPVIDKIFPFEHLPEAYQHATSQTKFGKVVVDFESP